MILVHLVQIILYRKYSFDIKLFLFWYAHFYIYHYIYSTVKMTKIMIQTIFGYYMFCFFKHTLQQPFLRTNKISCKFCLCYIHFFKGIFYTISINMLNNHVTLSVRSEKKWRIKHTDMHNTWVCGFLMGSSTRLL